MSLQRDRFLSFQYAMAHLEPVALDVTLFE